VGGGEVKEVMEGVRAHDAPATREMTLQDMEREMEVSAPTAQF
jgi:hypothetical protein